MHVPCSVPLQRPWSPVGYQVVEVSDPNVPTLVAVPPACGCAVPEAPLLPSSPVGYRVVVAEEKAARPSVLIKPRAPESPRRSSWKDNPLIVWGPIGAGAFGIMAITLILAIVRASDDEPAHGPLRAVFAVPRGPQVKVPEVGMVQLPRDVKPAAPVKAIEKPALAGAAGAALPALPDVPFCDKDGCKIERPAGARPDRETFGTTVEFARNPLEAARAAGAERKLTFILHVSGNFEEARFT
jgi:hypothetical protein